MNDISENKPCLVQTSQGFSVNYKGRLLYSKYNPAKNIVSIVEKTDILSGSIILCFSPILQYGLEELASKLPENCIMLGIEADPELYDLTKASSENLECTKPGIYSVVPRNELSGLPSQLEKLAATGSFRRVISIEFSGGTAFNQDFYNQLFEACRNSVSQFWKNRVTLVKFGRKYTSNVFKNLKCLNKGFNSVKTGKSILVVGAGESAVETLLSIKKDADKYFIIAVDAVLHTCKTLDIRPDAVVCEEAQAVITKAFTGCKDFFDYLFLSLTCTENVSRINPEKTIFYTPLFYTGNFLQTLSASNLLPNPQPPLGSVGLSAVNLALSIRDNENVPIFVTGLDFSFSIGQSHAKMSFHEKTRRINSSKLKSMESYGGSFNTDAVKVTGKNGEPIVTTTNLSGYAELFNYKFTGIKNLYDCGKTGLTLGIPAAAPATTLQGNTTAIKVKNTEGATKDFIDSEKTALIQLKDIFTGKIQLSEEERTKKITELLQPRDYLYLHFPDGYRMELTQNFLNRVRIEIDFFLKIIQ